MFFIRGKPSPTQAVALFKFPSSRCVHKWHVNFLFISIWKKPPHKLQIFCIHIFQNQCQSSNWKKKKLFSWDISYWNKYIVQYCMSLMICNASCVGIIGQYRSKIFAPAQPHTQINIPQHCQHIKMIDELFFAQVLWLISSDLEITVPTACSKTA